MSISRDRDSVTENKIYEFLLQAESTFPVPISEKTDLRDFARKLFEHATLCAIEEDGKIVSMVGGYTENTIHQVAFINMVATLPEHRGKGYAKKLVLEFIEKARQKGLKALHLYAVRENVAAMKMYQGIGFVEWHLESEKRREDVHFIYYLKKRTALVTAIGSFAADIVIKNLKKMDFRVIGTDIYAKELIVDAYNVDCFYQVPKVVDHDAFLAEIDRICELEGVTHILPSTDIEVDFFNANREHFEERNIVVCISSKEALSLCRDKKAQQEFIRENIPSVKTIPTVKMEKGMEMPFPLPLVCKINNGRSSQGLRYIYTEEEWMAAKNCEDAEDYIVQPVVDGRIVTVDIVREMAGVRADENSLEENSKDISKDISNDISKAGSMDKFKKAPRVIALPRVELLRTLNGAGLSVKVYPDRKLEEMCYRIADAFGVTGCVNFEFICDRNDGTYYYLECNPRFSGGVEFSCMAGYNCVENHIRCFEKKPIEDFQLEKGFFIARKYEEYITKVE